MAFSEDDVELRFSVVGKKCEKCGKKLEWNDRGPAGVGTWQAHHADGNPDNDAYSNCKILCWTCHLTA